MLKKSLSFALVIALVCALGGTSVFANTPLHPNAKSRVLETPSESNTVAANEVMPNGKLRADLLKLVADAKAGKISPAERP